MNGRTYLNLDDLLTLHTQLVEKFGGSSGIRDLSVLLSALERPQTGYYENLAEEGAALFQSLWLNHGFLDGNKRVAFAALDVFLRLNGVPARSMTQAVENQFLELDAVTVKDFNYMIDLIRTTYL